MFEGLRQDVRFGVRALWRTPGFTLTALTLLVLGIGAATAILSIAYTVLLRPLPYPNADRLVYLSEKGPRGIPWPDYLDVRARATSFEGLAGSLVDAPNLTSTDTVRRVEARSVTWNFFDVLGVKPYRGRLFAESDAQPSAPATVVLSHAFWMSEFGGSPAALNRTIALDDKPPYTIVGVLPPDFRYEVPSDVYLLIEQRIAIGFRGMQNRVTHTNFFGVARRKPTVSVEAAQAEMKAIAAALATEHGTSSKGHDVEVTDLADRLVADIAPTLTVLAGAVLLLLLIACSNLANLLLIRSASRAHEFTVRAALGGERRRLVRQLLVEQVILVAIGGVLGALVGTGLLRALVALAPRGTPRLDEVRLNDAVLLWTTGLSCLCAFAFGLLPALKASSVRGQQLLVRAGRGFSLSTSPLRRAMMIAEISLATVLLSGSALMVHTMWRLTTIDPGFEAHNLHSFMFALRGSAWPNERQQVFYDAMVERLRALPGVEDAAVTHSLPILGSNLMDTLLLLDRPVTPATTEMPFAAITPITARYFETMKIPLIKGRYFDHTEKADSQPVAVINEKAARQIWPGEDAIGKQIRQGFPNAPYGPWRTIVGIVRDVKVGGLDSEIPKQVYIPLVQDPRTTVFAVVRTKGAPNAAAIKAAFHEFNRTVPLFNERTLDQVIAEATSRRRVAMVVLSIFGVVAVVLALVGLYGVIAHSVAERTQEIGVRMALGATPAQVLRLFLRHGLVVTIIGLACGVLASIAAARSLASLVFGVSTTDPVTLAAVAALLTGAALAACYLPARAAARVDPLVALRVE
jgi:putative ABC transport system permease protein